MQCMIDCKKKKRSIFTVWKPVKHQKQKTLYIYIYI